jgi:hypothetical protein
LFPAVHNSISFSSKHQCKLGMITTMPQRLTCFLPGEKNIQHKRTLYVDFSAGGSYYCINKINLLYRLDRILICPASYQFRRRCWKHFDVWCAILHERTLTQARNFVYDVLAESKCLLAVSILRLLARHGLQYIVNVVITAVSYMNSQWTL